MSVIKDKRIQTVIDFIGSISLNLWVWIAPGLVQDTFKSIKAVTIIQTFAIMSLIVFGYELIRTWRKSPDTIDHNIKKETEK